MVTIRNSFHNTSITLPHKNVGDEVSLSTVRRVRRALCGMTDCCCNDGFGARDSEYSITERWNGKIIWYSISGPQESR